MYLVTIIYTTLPGGGVLSMQPRQAIEHSVVIGVEHKPNDAELTRIIDAWEESLLVKRGYQGIKTVYLTNDKALWDGHELMGWEKGVCR